MQVLQILRKPTHQIVGREGKRKNILLTVPPLAKGKHSNNHGDDRPDCHIVLGRFELPEGDVDSDTTLTLGLQLVKHPCVLEGTLAELGGFL